MYSTGRSRSLLLEMLIVILFLSIAAAILMQLFAAAHTTGLESQRTQSALLLARDAMERFSAGETLPEEYQAGMDGEIYRINIETRSESAGPGEMQYCAAAVSAGEKEYARLETARYLQGGALDE